MAIRKDLIDVADRLSDEQVMHLLSYAKFLEYSDEIPNAETAAAIKEVNAMIKNPSKYKSYSSFDELLQEVMQDDV